MNTAKIRIAKNAIIAKAATSGFAAQRLAPVFPDEQFGLGFERLGKHERGCDHDDDASHEQEKRDEHEIAAINFIPIQIKR